MERCDFFENDFNSRDYVDANFNNKVLDTKDVDFFTPNNTSDGMLKKAWIVENGKRYMLKGAYKKKQQEPFNEVLASMVSEKIGLNYVPYTIEVNNNIVLSKCECFIDEDTELLSAYSILKYYDVDLDKEKMDVMDRYINILTKEGMKHKKIVSSLAKMFVLDYLIMNKDRHLGNFGVIRNVETLLWEKVAPNYDSGQSMCSQDEIYEMNFERSYGRFFVTDKTDFEMILKIVKEYIDFNLDYEGLKEVADEWKKLLIKHQYISGISLDRINTLYKGLHKRIELLKNNLKKK